MPSTKLDKCLAARHDDFNELFFFYERWSIAGAQAKIDAMPKTAVEWEKVDKALTDKICIYQTIVKDTYNFALNEEKTQEIPARCSFQCRTKNAFFDNLLTAHVSYLARLVCEQRVLRWRKKEFFHDGSS
uniref:Uncharacterized protein n=1 Tax=Lobelia baumannii TaxID=2041123 RepID=A0A291F5S6_9ASTR|nr:hypothetical protein Lo_bau1Pt0202 [Lobelia baumannii]ATG27478.1 hypothetical protein Lo_bau1Pt0202 [Lobelia baumannii]